MMRITNAMMTSNTKNNININKLNEDKLNTQLSTGQKISRPSDDPVIAIRALRLNTNISQLNQYYEKNIPDATAWMEVTETALTQTNEIYTNIKENLTTGASDTNTASDRQKLLESLKGLRDEIYSSGNADYAERTVFTGYRTGESLTFLETDTDLNCNYKIHETFDVDDFKSYNYITTSSDGTEQTVTSTDINRLRLSYDTVKTADGKLVIKDSTGVTYSLSVTAKSIAGKSQTEIDDIYTGVTGEQIVLIEETGELILGDDAMEKFVSKGVDISYEYNKSSWESGDLRPEHYFACVQTVDGKDTYFNYDLKDDGTPDPTKPNFKNQDMQVEISFNQKITINTHADEVYFHDIGRELDDLIQITQDVVNCESTVTELQKQVDNATDETTKAALQIKLDAASKEFSLKKDKMQKAFSNAIDIYEDYADKNNLAIANIGSMQSRLEITKQRVADQLQSFKELADDNINASITDTAIDLNSAELALSAAQLAASKIAQQTLLDYL